MNNVDQFLQAFGDTQSPDGQELLHLIRLGTFARVSKRTGSWPCHQIAAIYRRQVQDLSAHERSDPVVLRQLSELVAELSRTPDADCELWEFSSLSLDYAVFVASSPHRFAGCIRSQGTPQHELDATGIA